jgi:alkanesulfonate monooxygenase SsuD/methylene tetrahydromethanopterin reductase-like flavin-dependent oxidoreductase (luciferase family)
MRGMLHGERPTAAGPRYAATAVRNDPPPIQQRLPLLVGGGGEQVTLRLVARYADANNVGGGFESVRRKEAILVEHCETVGRDPAEIERTTNIGTVVIRDSRVEAQRIQDAMFERNGHAPQWNHQPVGTPEDVAEQIAPFLDLGYRHLVAGFPSPYDDESMTRLATEVKALLEPPATAEPEAPRLATAD